MLNKEKLAMAGVDYNMALKRFGGNEALFEKFVYRFADDTHEVEGQKAYKAGDYEEVLKQIHALKGITGTLGMDNLFMTASNVVDAIRKDATDSLIELMPKLDAEYKKVMQLFD